MDAKSLALLLDIELACTFILQRSTALPPRGPRRGAPSHKEVDEILQRIAVALAKLSATYDGAHGLLSSEERDAARVLAERGPRAAAYDGARKVLLAAVPRLFFESQALICESREPWQHDSAASRGLKGPGHPAVASLRTRHA
jgi:hypothetical protein